MKAIRTMLWVFFLLGVPGFCYGQDADSRKLVLFTGTGITSRPGDAQMSMHFGLGVENVPSVKFGKIPGGFLFELLYAGPAQEFSSYIIARPILPRITDPDSGSAMVSANYVVAFKPPNSERFMTFFTAGYTRIIKTGNALNFGSGIDYVCSNNPVGIRFEVRNYQGILGAKESDLSFRVGLVIY